MKKKLRLAVLCVLLWTAFASPTPVNAQLGECLGEQFGIHTCQDLWSWGADMLCDYYQGSSWDVSQGGICIEGLGDCLAFQFYCTPIMD